MASTGLLFRPCDAGSLADGLADVHADPDRNRAMGEAASARYERDFAPGVGLERLTAEYRAAIAGVACAPV